MFALEAVKRVICRTRWLLFVGPLKCELRQQPPSAASLHFPTALSAAAHANVEEQQACELAVLSHSMPE